MLQYTVAVRAGKVQTASIVDTCKQARSSLSYGHGLVLVPCRNVSLVAADIREVYRNDRVVEGAAQGFRRHG